MCPNYYWFRINPLNPVFYSLMGKGQCKCLLLNTEIRQIYWLTHLHFLFSLDNLNPWLVSFTKFVQVWSNFELCWRIRRGQLQVLLLPSSHMYFFLSVMISSSLIFISMIKSGRCQEIKFYWSERQIFSKHDPPSNSILYLNFKKDTKIFTCGAKYLGKQFFKTIYQYQIFDSMLLNL